MKTKIILRIYMKSFIFKDSNCFNLTRNISSPAIFIKLYINWKKKELYGYTRSRGPNCAGLHHLTFGETWPCHFHMNTINRSLIEIISNISFPEIATSPSLHQHPPDGPTLVLTLPCNPNKSS